ncbi:MAG: glutaminyl-peptide cyclotransferase [Verrucomicrobiota bacterium]
MSQSEKKVEESVSIVLSERSSYEQTKAKPLAAQSARSAVVWTYILKASPSARLNVSRSQNLAKTFRPLMRLPRFNLVGMLRIVPLSLPLFLTTLTTPSLSAEAPTLSYEVVRKYPHDSSSFTQGLEMHQGRLYEGTGLRGRSALYCINLTTGKALNKVYLNPKYFGEGITIYGDRLFQLTWTSGKAIVYRVRDFKPIGSYNYQGQGWGLTNDSKMLIMSNGSDSLFFRNPKSFEIEKTLQVKDGEKKITQLNELEWIKGNIWANIWGTNKIAIIDPSRGNVTAWLDLTDLLKQAIKKASSRPIDVMNGIAYREAKDTILVTGKFWPLLFEIKTESPTSPSPE